MDDRRMRIDDLVDLVEGLGDVLTLRPGPGDGSPEIAWGDVFLYYTPDGVLPRTQPFATVVTKRYPDEPPSALDRPGAFRLNVAASAADVSRWGGGAPSEPDTVTAHPVYGGWLAVVDPGPRTADAVRELLRAAHARARARHERRSGGAALPPKGERSSGM